ncbi:helix-turn-helix transcriptional regulator [Shimazuella sp. AN120528]|uniref:helix-turn-helix domain-containing protein n=1 Tax=Shimazuella soli TaxID=1892854 RepID=UPI001F0EDB11|nr:tetratricopeptide repeat protein [Shimazuella soli]MCH5586487.1 helix-turn-helix transcriptional regulator [Shimazuella soli]
MQLPLEKIGPILRKKRMELGLRINDLADEQISKSTISNAERGLPIVTEAMYLYLAEKLKIKHSLLNVLEESEQQEQAVMEQLLALEGMISTDPIEALQKLEQIKQNYSITKNTYLYALHTFLLGRCAFEQKKWQKSKTLLKEVVERTKQQRSLASTNLFSACMNDLGRIAYYENQIEDALHYSIDGLSRLDKQGERAHYRFHLLLNKGIYLEKMNEPEKALEAIQDLEKEINSYSSICDALYVIHVDIIIQMHSMYASIYNELQLYQKAFGYVKNGIIIAQKNKQFDQLLLLRTTLGIILSNLGRTNEAKKCYLEILELRKRVDHEHDFVFAYVELGQLYIKQKNWLEAEKTLKQAIAISKRNNDLMHLMECSIRLGDCFVEQQQYRQAIKYYEEAQRYLPVSENLQKEREIITNLGYCYFQLGDKVSLEIYQQKSLQINSKIRWGD